MRLRRLQIEHFGVLTDQTLDFGDTAFHVVLGANEAGKSTLLQLIRELFFGFHPRSPYDFDDRSGEMAATAVVQMANGNQVEFRRRKGRTNQVVGHVEPSRHEIDAEGLARLLGGATRELYEHVFGFSLDELASGEKSLAHANLNEALYGGALGGLANFQKVQAQMRAEADDLFTPKGRERKTINRFLTKIKKVEKELRDAMVKPRDYQRLIKSCEKRRTDVEVLRKSLEGFRQREAHLQRLSQALQPWLTLNAAQIELAELNVPDGFPHDGGTQFDQLKQQREQVEAEIDENRLELEDTVEALLGTPRNAEFLDHEAAIKRFVPRLGEIGNFRRDIPLRRQESESHKARVSAMLRELNPDWDLSQLAQFRTSLEQRNAVELSKNELDQLQKHERELTIERQTAGKDLKALQTQLDNLGSDESSPELKALATDANKYEIGLGNLLELRRQFRNGECAIASLLQRLQGPLGVTLDPNVDLPVPLEATVAEFRERLDAARRNEEKIRDRVTDARNDLEQAIDDLAQLDAGVSVPDRERLHASREHRDRGWQIIRRKFVEQQPVSNSEIESWQIDAAAGLPDQFERAIAAADRLADERQEKSQDAAKRDQLAFKIESIQQRRVPCAEQEAGEAESLRAKIESEWSDLWSKCPFPPLSPAAMLDWLKNYAEFRKARDQAASHAAEIAAVEAALEEFEARLAAAFPDSEDSPAQLLLRAQDRVDAARDRANKREAIADQIATKQNRLNELDKAITAAAEQKRDWQRQWEALLSDLGFPESWNVHLAMQILNGLSTARSEYEKAESLDLRVRDMSNGIKQFDEEVKEVCRRIAEDLLKLPAEDSVVRLNERLDAARHAEREHARLQEYQTKLERRGVKLNERLQGCNHAIERLLRAAECESEDQLCRVAEQFTRHAELRSSMDAANRELRIIRGTEAEQEFRENLASADADSIAACQRQVREEITAADESYQTALRELTLEKNQLEQLERASGAADRALDLESSRSELASAVHRWAPLVLAQTLMKRAVEKFEREHQPAMIGEIRRLFSHMTAGRYTDIKRKLDEHGTLQLVERNGRPKEPCQLSRGTREQLYLAIRLAYINHYCTDGEPLPIVMDDVLVNFDPERANRTVEVLREVAANVQIIFMTCHDHTLHLIRRVMPALQPILLPQDST